MLYCLFYDNSRVSQDQVNVCKDSSHYDFRSSFPFDLWWPHRWDNIPWSLALPPSVIFLRPKFSAINEARVMRFLEYYPAKRSCTTSHSSFLLVLFIHSHVTTARLNNSTIIALILGIYGTDRWRRHWSYCHSTTIAIPIQERKKRGNGLSSCCGMT